MKVVILAGGLGTRLAEETDIRPKPMVEIGGKPILWHIMKIYAEQGFNDFIICGGYKQDYIKEYFRKNIRTEIGKEQKWFIDNIECEFQLVNTGDSTMTGGRIKRIQQYINNEPFMLTYGDGVANIDLNKLVDTHKQSNKICTVTATQPTGRFGGLKIDHNTNSILKFEEKPKDQWINGGFFVCQPEIFSYIKGDDTIFEKEPLETLASQGQLGCYKHEGFWKCMDTLKDKNDLNQMWNENKAEWKIWK